MRSLKKTSGANGIKLVKAEKTSWALLVSSTCQCCNGLFFLRRVLIFFEIILNFLIRYLKKDFKWLINYEDEKPKFEKKNLSNFYQNSFDNLLGWDRKKNSSGFELSSKKTFFYISKIGNRGKSKFKK